MMKLRKKIGVTVVAIAATIGAALTYAADKYYDGDSRADRMVEKITKRLSLDDVQKDKLTILMIKYVSIKIGFKLF